MSQQNENNASQGNPPPISADSVSWPDFRTQSELLQAADLQQSGGRVYPAQGNKFAEILKSFGVIDDKILSAVEKRHHTKKLKDKPTGELLVYMGIIEPEVLTRVLCIQSGILLVDLQAINIPYNVLHLVANEVACEKRAIPVSVHKGTLYLAVDDPLHFSEQRFFSFSTKLQIKPVFASSVQIDICLKNKWTEGRDIWSG